MSTFQAVLSTIQREGYVIIFVLMFIEGPVVTAAAGFAASLGIFNVYIILALSTAANVAGDLVYYWVGSISRKSILEKYIKMFNVKKSMFIKMERGLKKHTGKAMSIIKVIPPLPLPGLIAAGAAGVQMKKFLFYSVLISLLMGIFYTAVGFYTGVAFNAVARVTNYVEVSVIGLMVLIIVGWFMYQKFLKKWFTKIERTKI
ncbi:MAG: VTT domain-containing protein [Candidatus Woesearchaeota archaeon]